MNFWKSEHVFTYRWEEVVRATMKKYPNPYSKSVVSTDVLEREVTANGVIRTHRLLKSDSPLPKWAVALNSMCESPIASEHSELNRNQRSLLLLTKNVTLCSIFTVHERLHYAPHPDNANWTVLKQDASISLNLPGKWLENTVTQFLKNTFNTNAAAGRKAIEWLCQRDRLAQLASETTNTGTLNSLN